jgi:nucleoside diphosphate kinase
VASGIEVPGPSAYRATNPAAAKPGTIRGDLALFFSEDELHSYARDVDRWVFEA